MDVETIVSDAGYGANGIYRTTHALVVKRSTVPTAKITTCLSQLYHETKRGRHCRLVNSETFLYGIYH